MNSKDKTAIAVGYSFAMVPNRELEGIHLNSAGAVRFENENQTLYKAATYEESKKLDTLLDRYGEYRIKDYKIEPVIMSGVIEMKIPKFQKEKDALSFGAYAFMCNEKIIPVDFSGTAWDITQFGDHLTVSFVTGQTPLLTDGFLDDCYLEEYEERELRYNYITAEFLSKADKIYEFMVTAELDGEEYLPEEIHEMGMFQLKSLEFFNGEKTFEMNPKAIEAFNQSLDDYKKNRIWITIYKDILGIDDWDNLTSICIPKDQLETKLRANGETLDEWLNEYTADDTDSLARDALIENMVRDYEKKDLRELYKIKAQNNQENTKDKENNLQEKNNSCT